MIRITSKNLDNCAIDFFNGDHIIAFKSGKLVYVLYRGYENDLDTEDEFVEYKFITLDSNITRARFTNLNSGDPFQSCLEEVINTEEVYLFETINGFANFIL